MRRLTKQLFEEFNPDAEDSLARWRTVFVESNDPTEYEAAIVLAGSWEDWQKFKKDWPAFRNTILPEWLLELEIKMRSGAIRKMASAEDTSALKWIAEGKYRSPPEKQTYKGRQQEKAVKKGMVEDLEDIERVAQANVVKLERNR